MQPDLHRDMARLERSHFWFRGRRAVLSSCLRRYQPAMPHGPILDAGCGIGANLELLSHYREIVGIDLYHAACQLAAGKCPGHLVEGVLEKLPFRDDTFSMAALLDVLEHVDEQQAVLRELTRTLQHGGILVVTVPAFRHLWSDHDIVHQHRRRYSAVELQRELETAGFKVAYLSYFNTLLYPVVFISRLLTRHRASTPVSHLQILPRWLNATLYAIFCCERLWLGRLRIPIGASLVAIAKKY